MRILAALFVIALLTISAGTPAEGQRVQANPLEPFAKMIGGIWVSEDAVKDPDSTYVKTRADWGVNKRVIRSRVWQVTGRNERLIMEGGIYWHPGRKEAVMWAVDEGGAVMEGVYSVEEGVMLSKWKYFTSRQTVEGENRTSYSGDDSMVIEEYFHMSGELRHARTRKMVRKDADWGETKLVEAAKDTPSELKLLEPHVGGKWVESVDGSDPRVIYNCYSVEWAVSRRLARISTFAVTGNRPTQTHEGAHFWHPSRNEVVFIQVSDKGEVLEGVSSQTEDEQVSTWKTYRDDREHEYRQSFRFKDEDTSDCKIAMKVGEEWKESPTFHFLRKPLDWTSAQGQE